MVMNWWSYELSSILLQKNVLRIFKSRTLKHSYFLFLEFRKTSNFPSFFIFFVSATISAGVTSNGIAGWCWWNCLSWWRQVLLIHPRENSHRTKAASMFPNRSVTIFFKLNVLNALSEAIGASKWQRNSLNVKTNLIDHAMANGHSSERSITILKKIGLQPNNSTADANLLVERIVNACVRTSLYLFCCAE